MLRPDAFCKTRIEHEPGLAAGAAISELAVARFLLTLWLSACAGLAATLLGFVLAAMRDSSLRPLRWLAVGYSSLFHTPLLVQLFFGISPPGRSCRPPPCSG